MYGDEKIVLDNEKVSIQKSFKFMKKKLRFNLDDVLSIELKQIAIDIPFASTINEKSTLNIDTKIRQNIEFGKDHSIEELLQIKSFMEARVINRRQHSGRR